MFERLRSVLRYIIRKIEWENGEDIPCWEHVDSLPQRGKSC